MSRQNDNNGMTPLGVALTVVAALVAAALSGPLNLPRGSDALQALGVTDQPSAVDPAPVVAGATASTTGEGP